MTLYLSARFEDGPAVQQMRDALVQHGFRVRARWLDAEVFTPATAQADQDGAAARLAAIARADLEDIDDADAVVVFNPAEAREIGRGGRHVETGYALARGKLVIVFGGRSNVFHWLPDVTVVEQFQELLHVLREAVADPV